MKFNQPNSNSLKPTGVRTPALMSGVAGLVLILSACGGSAEPAPQVPATDPATDNPVAAPPVAAQPASLDDALIALNAAIDINGAVIGDASADHRGTLVIVFASWCSNCRTELAMLGGFRLEHPDLRIVGLNAYEDYADRGNEAAMRSYVAENAPWMRVVRSTPELLAGFGTPKKVPSVFVYDRNGKLAQAFDRAKRPPPNRARLDEVYAALPN